MKWILRGLLLLMGAIFLLSLMVVAAVLFLLSLIRWLFTGRKPSYRQQSGEDIIEAEVKEVRAQKDSLPIPQRKE
jgi:hypothetical protein